MLMARKWPALALIRAMGLEGTVHGTTPRMQPPGLRAEGETAAAKRPSESAGHSGKPASGGGLPPGLYTVEFALCGYLGRLELAAEIHPKALSESNRTRMHRRTGNFAFQSLGRNVYPGWASQRAHRCLERAVSPFEQQPPGRDDPHHPAALCALAEPHFHQGRAGKSAELFRRALGLIERTMAGTMTADHPAWLRPVARRMRRNKTGTGAGRGLTNRRANPLSRNTGIPACHLAAGLGGRGVAVSLSLTTSFRWASHPWAPPDYRGLSGHSAAGCRRIIRRWRPGGRALWP